MPGPEQLLAESRSVLLVDWPSRDVPDSLARAGLAVSSQDGPDTVNVYTADGDEVTVRQADGPPDRVDFVFAYRPIDELPGIVEEALQLSAQAVWLQSGRDSGGALDPRGCWLPTDELEQARAMVESAGLEFISGPYIADVARRQAAQRGVGPPLVE